LVCEEPSYEALNVEVAWLEDRVALSCSPRLVLLFIAGGLPLVGDEIVLLKDGVALLDMPLLLLLVPIRTAEEPACEPGREEANALVEAAALSKLPPAMLLMPFRAVDDAKSAEA
jgi:hypothetical protein